MGLATLNGVAFRIDPMSVGWSYSIKTAEKKTLGGRVVQVLGAVLGDMTVRGSFGRGGWEEQHVFLERMTRLAEAQVAESGPGREGVRPMRFSYAPEGWDFLVNLKGFEQPGAGGSVRLDIETANIEWELTFHIVEDNSGLKQVAQDAFIARIAAGLGWQQTKWNGAMSFGHQQSFRGETVGTTPMTTPTIPDKRPTNGAY